MTLAVIKTGGKQYIVTPGQKLKIEKLPKEVGDEVVFDEVLLTHDDQKTEIGMPLVKSTKVTAKVLSQGKGKKIVILKYKPKIRYHKKTGHRQLYTEIQIKTIEA
jgi:large subunit ribosomal protein L21